MYNAQTWNKRRRFGMLINLGTNTYQVLHLVSGEVSSRTAIGNTRHHIGFKIDDKTLYGTVANGTTESTLNMGTVATGTYYRLECDFVPGTSCDFYLNGTLKGTLTANLPSGTTDAEYISYLSISNTEAEDKSISIYEVRVFQEP